MTCSMTADAQLSTWFSARGDRASLKVTNPVGPHWGHQLTITTPEGETIETVPGDTTYTHQLRAFVAAVRGGERFPTDGVDGIVGMRIIDDVYRAAGLPPRAT
jgi:predicted dehydrogenase